MKPVIRQRLVGILVLVTLGVVFWPIMFVDPDNNESIVLPPMPDEPNIDTSLISTPESYRSRVISQTPIVKPVSRVEQDQADQKTLIKDDWDIDKKELPASTFFDSINTESPDIGVAQLLDEQGLPIFWVLQVATFSTEERAIAVVDQLRSKGFKAFKRSHIRVDDELFRVQIGPNMRQDDLLKIKPSVDRSLKVDSKILRYVQTNE